MFGAGCTAPLGEARRLPYIHDVGGMKCSGLLLFRLGRRGLGGCSGGDDQIDPH